MSFAIVAVGGLVAGGAGSYMSYKAAGDAADAQKDASRRFESKMEAAAFDVQGYSDEYVNTLDEINNKFDPYNMEQAFNSLYEAVIQPMERDFDENVLPSIQAAYSGGIMGAEAGLSGAASEATARAERGLSEKKADLRYQERGNAIQRNYAEYERRVGLAKDKFGGQTAAPLMRAEMAPQIYGAQTDSIAATLAAGQAGAQGVTQFGTSLMSGANLYASGQRTDAINKNTDALLKPR